MVILESISNYSYHTWYKDTLSIYVYAYTIPGLLVCCVPVQLTFLSDRPQRSSTDWTNRAPRPRVWAPCLGPGSGVWGFRVQGSGFRVQGSGFRKP